MGHERINWWAVTLWHWSYCSHFIDEETETQSLNDVPVDLTAKVWTAEPSSMSSSG